MTFLDPREVPLTEAAEAAGLLAGGQIVLLDVREPAEWDAGHAPGATHVPLGALTPDALAPASVVVAVCRSGHRSLQAATALHQAGIDARNLTGGMKAWAAQGFPVVRNDGSPGTVV